MLKASVQGRNGLRRSDPGYVPDLSAVDLEGRDLSGADLRRAHLTYVDFSNADLSGTDLRGADLHGAEFRGAKLEKALLENTILDPSYWTKPLLALWQEASLARRERLVRALEMKTALHRKWLDGLTGSPEALLSERGATTDDFTFAWDTYAISEENVLDVLRAAAG